jgi:uncharacterized protein YndB with AHSA1/START domain
MAREIWHEITINAAPRDIYRALTNLDELAHWWTTDTRGKPTLGGTLEFWFGAFHQDMEVVALTPSELVRWRCKTTGMDEWAGTEIEFQIFRDAQGRTQLHFRHSKWRDDAGMFPHCSMRWAVFLISLKEFVETGKGRPFPFDMPVNSKQRVLEPAA